MQVSVKTLASLIVVRSDPMTKALYAVLGDNFDRADYVLTQSDADNIAAHLDAQHAENDRSLPSALMAEVMGKTPRELHHQAATDLNDATQYALRLFSLAGLHTPDSWLS